MNDNYSTCCTIEYIDYYTFLLNSDDALFHRAIIGTLINALFVGRLDSVNSVHLPSFVFRYICYFIFSYANGILVMCRCYTYSRIMRARVHVSVCAYVYTLLYIYKHVNTK